MPAQQVEVDPAVRIAFESGLAGIAALGDLARRDVSIAATRANRAMINEECGKRAEDIRGIGGTSRLSPVSPVPGFPHPCESGHDT